MRFNIIAALLAVSTLLIGCDSVDETGGRTSVKFQVVGSSAAAKTAAGTLEIAGTNGTLRLTGVHLIVAEFELERLEYDDCDLLGELDDDGCEEFQAPPFFVDLPLDNTEVTVAASSITPDTYKELEFEIERLDDDDVPAAVAAALLAEIRQDIPDWPSRASMAFVGEFEETGGAIRPFTVYADAEIEIEMDLVPPITIDSAADDHDITVVVDPSEWLKSVDGSVLDLSARDYGTTGDLLEFEVEIEDGFKEIEFDD